MFDTEVAICRICGSEHNLMHVFQGGQELLEKLRVCANIIIDFESNLPKHICIKCEQGLNLSYRLRKQGEALGTRLRERLAAMNKVEDVESELQEFRVENISKDDDDVQIIEDDNSKGNAKKPTKKPEQKVKYKEKTPLVNEKRIQIVTPENDVQIIEDFISIKNSSESNCNESEIIVYDNKHDSSSSAHDDEVQLIEDIPITTDVYSFLNGKKRSSEKDDNAEIIEAFNALEELKVNLDMINQEVNSMIQIGVGNYLNNRSSNRQQQQTEEVETFIPMSENVAATIAPDYAVIHQDDVDITSLGNMDMNESEALITSDIINIDDDDLVELCPDSGTVTYSENSHILAENTDHVESETYNIDLVDNIVLDDSNDRDYDPNQENTSTFERNIGLFKNRKHLKVSMIYKCDTCGESFNNHMEYRAHVKVHGKDRFNCIQCNKWFPTRYRLQQHERTHSYEVEIFRCPHCESSYRHRQNLKRHIRASHSTESIYHCEDCSETFNRIDVLRNHMLKHVTERKYKCELCPKSFKSMLYLVGHLKTHKRKENAEKQPESERTPTAAGNTDSSKTVTHKRTYTCFYCGKISTHHFAHKNHLRTHTLERPYACDLCPKTFRTMAAKITHERIHNDLRPYQCDRCLVSFRQPSHLKEHKLIHDGVMPYVCNICNMAFNRKSNMKVHMRIHTGERPYKCAEVDCGQQFTKLIQLKRHAAQAHSRDVDVVPDDEEDNEEGEDDNEATSAEDTAEEDNNAGNMCNQMEMENGYHPPDLEVENDSEFSSLYILDDDS